MSAPLADAALPPPSPLLGGVRALGGTRRSTREAGAPSRPAVVADLPAEHAAASHAATAAPGDPAARHRQGRALLALGQPEAAFSHLLAALEAAPAVPAHWISIVEALVGTGAFEAARHLIEQARKIGLRDAALDDMRALLLRGATASVAHGATRLDGLPTAPARRDDGSAAVGRPMSRDPAPRKDDRRQQRARALLRRGEGALAAGRPAGAEAAWREALRACPDLPGPLTCLAGLLRDSGRAGEAEALLRAALARDPSPAEPHFARAEHLYRLGRDEEAEPHAREALARDPAGYGANVLLGTVLARRGDAAAAEAPFRAALAARPDSSAVLLDLGDLMRRLDRQGEAEAAFRRAAEVEPRSPAAGLRLGQMYREQERLADAEAAARRALAHSPRDPRLLHDLAHARFAQGHVAEALAAIRAALDAAPDSAELRSVLLFCLLHHPEVSPAEVFEAHRDWGRRAEAAVVPRAHAAPGPGAAGRLPRLGFVSGDLYGHAVATFLLPVWADLAARGFAIHAYSTSPRGDAVTARLRPLAAGGWRDIAALSDEEACRAVAEDGVDILFDLSGHTARARLGIFARRAAPVQVSWIGYPATTGLTRMDYLLISRAAAPPGRLDDQFTERLVRLPRTTLFDGLHTAPPPGPLPALAEGRVTFGSFNRMMKSGQHVVDLWARVLREVPGSRFLLGGMRDDAMRAEMARRFAEAGVGPERLLFRPHCADYLRFHDEVDLLLDAFPYAGGTTTCWGFVMGVPTLTLAGDTFVGRVGVSLLGHVGLEGFVASDAEDYVARAAGWARRLPELAEIRAGLRARAAATLLDPDAVGRGLASALRTMWRRHCDGLPPEAFEVPADA